METYSEEVVEAGVDWVTARSRNPVRAQELAETGQAYLAEQVGTGWPEKDWSWYGFVGKQAGATRWGSGDRGSVVIVSGSPTHRKFRSLRNTAEQITRVDFCCTVRIVPPSKSISSEHYTRAVGLYGQRDGYPRPSLWVGSEGGATFYLGDRSSNYYGRVYNKEIESGDEAYEGCWRYEVEVKGPAADDVSRLAERSSDLVQFAAGYVRGYFLSHDIEPRYEAQDRYSRVAAPYREQTDANSLGWLARAVRPTVAALVKRRLVAEVYEALGLTL